ncbi:hypothetical protein SB717_36180, partial [Priestia sp. SIMBA_032]|uniref:hypothetical protein n=1 Tax=Priestia sp. SIMBA_032 TaxID=3085775 RepID=UPI0039787BE1
WRMGFDVGTHHDHVARIKRRIVLEQPQHQLTQHLDLASGTVAGMDLDAAVGLPARFRDLIGAERILQSLEMRAATNMLVEVVDIVRGDG